MTVAAIYDVIRILPFTCNGAIHLCDRARLSGDYFQLATEVWGL